MLARLGRRMGTLLRRVAQALDEEPAENSGISAQSIQTPDSDLAGVDLHDAPEHWIQMLRDGGIGSVTPQDASAAAPWSPDRVPPPDGPFGAGSPPQHVWGSERSSMSGASRPPDPGLIPPDSGSALRRWADKSPGGRLRLSHHGAAPGEGGAGRKSKSSSATDPSDLSDLSDLTARNEQRSADIDVDRPPAVASNLETSNLDNSHHDRSRGTTPADPPPFDFPARKIRTPATSQAPLRNPPTASPISGQPGRGQHGSGRKKESYNPLPGIAEPDAKPGQVRSRNHASPRATSAGAKRLHGEESIAAAQVTGQGQSRPAGHNGSSDAQATVHTNALARANAQALARASIQAIAQAQLSTTATGQNSAPASQSPWPELNHSFRAPIAVTALSSEAPEMLERSLARAQRLRAEQAGV